MPRFAVSLFALFLAVPALAIEPFPASFHASDIATNGTTLHVRVGGSGPAVILLHGFADTGDMWAPAAAALMKDHTVIVPDLRGMGLSAHPDTGYALAVQYPERITKWMVIDAPLPGIANWEEIKQSPLLWHFNFRGPDEERLVAGRERIYLDRFYNELSADPKKIDEATREHYAALYARPHAIHDAFEQFGAFNQDALDNKALLAEKGKLKMPVLAVGGEKSAGKSQAEILNAVATNVSSDIIPASGHWIMEENPKATVAMMTAFLSK